jgi:hypothetical protein
MTTVIKTEVPPQSLLRKSLANATFYDAYAAPLGDEALSPAEIFIQVSRAAPRWASQLMSIRNRIARRIGLKDVGAMETATDKAAETYRVGDRLGIFRVFANTENEVLLGIDDRHLDVRVSVLKAQLDSDTSYVFSTMVHVHNWLGHLYMAPVGRIHPLIVKAMMRRAVV